MVDNNPETNLGSSRKLTRRPSFKITVVNKKIKSNKPKLQIKLQFEIFVIQITLGLWIENWIWGTNSLLARGQPEHET